MEKMISKEGNVGYRYDEGERPDFDAFIDRLSKFGLSKEYLYDTIFEIRDVTDNFDYGGYDAERVKKLGYPVDWLRRCGVIPRNFEVIPDVAVIAVCESLKQFDSMADMAEIVFNNMEIPENIYFDSSALDYDNAPERVNMQNDTKETEETKKENIFTKISNFFKKEKE